MRRSECPTCCRDADKARLSFASDAPEWSPNGGTSPAPIAIPSPAELLAPKVDVTVSVETHVRAIVATLRAKPHAPVTIRDVPAVVNRVGNRMSTAGWAVTYQRGGARDGGHTDAVTITAPTGLLS